MSTSTPAGAARRHHDDLDGLRAVAVLAVLLCHAEVPGAAGGFIGVDVFFVLSGFFIGRILVEDLRAGTFRFRTFFERRARRILPALGVTLALTLAASWMWLLPSALRGAGRSVAAAAASASNVLFYWEGGYFDGPAKEKPLLHTWSLGVEEQFYLALPLALWCLWRRGERAAISALALLACLSFAAAELTVYDNAHAVFFLPQFRAWELLIGVLLVWVPTLRAGVPAQLCAASGLAAIVAAAHVMSPEWVFPGASALWPCAGAALLILCRDAATVTGRALASAPLVWIGRISYSLYLLHWPLLSLLSHLEVFDVTPLERASACLAAFVLSALSYRWIEQPFRRGQLLPRPRQIALAAAVLIAVAVVGGAALHVAQGAPQRFPAEVSQLDRLGVIGVRTTRPDGRMVRRDEQGRLVYGDLDAAPSIALVGDSHAAAFADPLGREALVRGEALVYLSANGTAPLRGVDFLDNSDGREWFEATLASLIDDPALEQVVLCARWALPAGGFAPELGTADLGRSSAPRIRAAGSHHTPTDDEARALFHAGLEATVAALLEAGKRVVLVDPIPEVGYDVPRTLAKLAVRGRDPARFTRPAALYFERQADVLACLAELAARGVTRVDPTRALRRGEHMLVHAGGAPLYSDDNHLSRLGAELVAPLCVEALWPPASVAPPRARPIEASAPLQRE